MATEHTDTANPASASRVEAKMLYAVDTGEKPVSETGPDGRLQLRAGDFEERTVVVEDARPDAGQLSIDREGVALVHRPTAVRDLTDEEEIKRVYYPEIEQLLKAHTGAHRVVVFDHTIRSADDEKGLRLPVKVVHNDYTEDSAPKRVRDLLPADEAGALLQRRFAVIQVWRPMHRVHASPLAICDARSMAGADLIAAERRHPDRVGEIYHIAHNPAHRWLYFPHLERDEALVFKCYDSARDGRARFTAHCAFELPDTSPDTPPRESIEMRTLAFF